MKRLTSLLIGCSLTLAGAALAQQPVQQQSPSKSKHAPEKTHATQAQPKPNAAKPEAPAATQQHGAMKEHPATHEPGAMKEHGATHEHGATNEPGAGKAKKLQHTRSLRPLRKRMFPVNRRVRERPTARQQRIEERRKGDEGPRSVRRQLTNPAAPAAAGGRCSSVRSGSRPAKCAG